MHTPDPQTQSGFYDSVPAKRLFAWVIDVVVITGFCIVITPFTGFLSLFLWAPFWLIISFLYRWMTLKGGSATFGMRIMAIELRTAEGERFDSRTAFAHTLGYSVSIALPILQIISIIMMATSAKGQGLTDVILNSVAINRRLSRRL